MVAACLLHTQRKVVSEPEMQTPIVTSADATRFPNPNGIKLSTSRCSDLNTSQACNLNGPMKSQYPILMYDGYTYWPLSYNDDRSSFAIVVTKNSSTTPIALTEVEGARYIDSIEVHSHNDTVRLIGQGFISVEMLWTTLKSTTATSISAFTLATTASNLNVTEFEDELDAGTIVGIIFGCIFGVMSTVIGGYLYHRTRTRRNQALSRQTSRSTLRTEYPYPPTYSSPTPTAHRNSLHSQQQSRTDVESGMIADEGNAVNTVPSLSRGLSIDSFASEVSDCPDSGFR